MLPLTIDQALHRAIQHHKAGRVFQAEALYRQILAQQPNHSDALNLCGLVAHGAGRQEEAARLIRQAIALNPHVAEPYSSLGNVFCAMGKLDEGVAAYGDAIRLRPDLAEPHCNLGNALTLQKKFAEAVDACSRAIQIEPLLAEAHNNLGLSLCELGEYDKSAFSCLRAVQLKPNFAAAWYNLGNALREQGRFIDAIDAFSKAVALQPGRAEFQGNLGNVLREQGRFDEAVIAFQRAIALKPSDLVANLGLGNVLMDESRIDEAIRCYDRALASDPQHAGIASGRLYVLHFRSNMDPASIYREHCNWGRRYAATLFPPKSAAQGACMATAANVFEPDRPLRIGYVSPDLFNHPVGRFLLPLAHEHDQTQFRVFCYSDVRIADAVTDRLRGHVDGWRNTSRLSDEQLARSIQQDQIDILVDLAGHTAQNRLPAFARKPAPIQVTYLGYPDTTGMFAMDYRIADSFTDPPGMTEAFHTEQIERLPDSFLCFAPVNEFTKVAPLPAPHRGHVTFGSFNAFPKINAATISLWAQILANLPSARLLIKCKAMVSPTVRKQLLDLFAAHGIAADRLELHHHLTAHAEHMRMYGQVDIALDTFPYHGTTTTCEALWMGVPVVSLAGQTHVSRVGVSILSNTGLPELIAQSPDQYVQIAGDLATNLSRLDGLRSTLRGQMELSPLMDGPAFARNFEAAFRRMWRRLCARQSPAGANNTR